MKLVVSDTSPLNYLILIQAEAILPALFGLILVPAEVIEELSNKNTPLEVHSWIKSRPEWVRVVSGEPARFPLLGPGEAAALSIAIDRDAQLLVDELEARQIANSLGVETIGTVGVLAEAHLKSMLDFDQAMAALRQTTFRVHGSIIEAAKERIRQRRS